MYNNQNYIYLKKSKNNENIETYFFLIVMDDSNKQKIFLAISNDVETPFLIIQFIYFESVFQIFYYYSTTSLEVGSGSAGELPRTLKKLIGHQKIEEACPPGPMMPGPGMRVICTFKIVHAPAVRVRIFGFPTVTRNTTVVRLVCIVFGGESLVRFPDTVVTYKSIR